MKYFEPGDILLSDFDGVYIDSQRRFSEVMGTSSTLEQWMEYLSSLNWRKFLLECEEMPYATETYLELQELGILKGFITQIHSFEEGREKSTFIREKGLFVPIYYVLPEQRKSAVYQPNAHTILLDDKPRNTGEWENQGGKSILFNPENEVSNKVYIKKMSELLTK